MTKKEITEQDIISVGHQFGLKGEYRAYETLKSGNINKTFKVYYFRDGELKDYIFQVVNTYVFKEPIKLMENISSITEHIRTKIKSTGTSAKRLVLHYSQTANGEYYYIDKDNRFWRCYRFIDDSVTFDKTENLGILEESGKAFGEFQIYLSDYSAEKLFITIPHFHNTVNRYQMLKETIESDSENRRSNVQKEINDYLELEEIATKMYKMQKSGELKLRVTHNDTKCNNVLFDSVTLKHLCVIDLDTIMPGLAGFDFGDAIRFGANTSSEDEADLSKVSLNLEKFEAFTKGFMATGKDALTDVEIDTLALGAITMTVECGARFLTDYLDGDKYFKIDYPEHNLVRCRCQLALAKDMLSKRKLMEDIVNKYRN